MLKQYATGFSVAYDEKGIMCISDSGIRLILPPQLWKMTHHHQIMCGWKMCIQARTYKESLNHWRKRQLRYINNCANSLTRVSAEQLNRENIYNRYSDVVLPDGE